MDGLLIDVETDSVLVEQFSAVLPLNRIFSHYQSSDFEVKFHWCILFTKIHYCSKEVT